MLFLSFLLEEFSRSFKQAARKGIRRITLADKSYGSKDVGLTRFRAYLLFIILEIHLSSCIDPLPYGLGTGIASATSYFYLRLIEEQRLKT
ncbi:hypothetical protein Nepgr_009994 [Nepenthes gracilis]|uniref:Uncharacterized protein n=1 Tax=Nepenthes gracilis TaxID=150966 RepID=A0AAD3SC77_NEPGR|nr:hypothetical protein Nepgr_009994 [Nepenthes gracilis]